MYRDFFRVISLIKERRFRGIKEGTLLHHLQALICHRTRRATFLQVPSAYLFADPPRIFVNQMQIFITILIIIVSSFLNYCMLPSPLRIPYWTISHFPSICLIPVVRIGCIQIRPAAVNTRRWSSAGPSAQGEWRRSLTPVSVSPADASARRCSCGNPSQIQTGPTVNRVQGCPAKAKGRPFLLRAIIQPLSQQSIK